MVSSKAVVFVVSTIIVVITLFYFALPVTSILHASAVELNMKSYYALTDAIKEANTKGMGITDKIYLQNNYFIVFFRNNEVLDKLVKGEISGFEVKEYVFDGSRSGYMYYRSGVDKKVYEVDSKAFYGEDELNKCDMDENCVCLVNLDYYDPSNINTWIYQIGTEQGGFGCLDRVSIQDTTMNKWETNTEPYFYEVKLFKPLGCSIPQNNMKAPILEYRDGEGKTHRFFTDFSTLAFMDQFISKVGKNFTLTFVECKPMKELCSCDICSLYADEYSCTGTGYEEGSHFGCAWDSEKGMCYNEKNYENSTNDCSLWIISDKVRQIYSITERSKFDYIIFKKEGCALQWFDSSKRPIGTDSIFYEDYGGELFVEGKGEDKDKIGACEPCFQTIPVEQCGDQQPCCKEEAKCSPI